MADSVARCRYPLLMRLHMLHELDRTATAVFDPDSHEVCLPTLESG